MTPSGLPIDEALPALCEALARQLAVVLQAPPGAGKSTVVPLVLIEQPWARERRILMLEPRRLAARAVAQRMARTLGEPVGSTVGYRMRLETRVSRATRIEVVTEGVLTRMLQSDPALEGVAALIFDEFHERSLQADLGLALALDVRENLAPELRLLIMSATLDAAGIAAFLGAPTVTAAGRSFPVEARFLGKGAPLLPAPGSPAAESVERLTARLVRRALEEESGDVLVFLPGAAEIRRVQGLLGPEVEAAARVLPLYGDLAAAEQDAALAPSAPGSRKVVLATNIAETSLTIEGVRVVVDSGLARRSQFDPVTGMSRLVTQRISRASAEQRQGRAGRLAPGVCYRAWSEGAHASLASFTPPEILEADLTPLSLELAAWGVREATQLRWLDAPPAATLAAARELLRQLGALDHAGTLTDHGRAMAGVGLHPRLAHMLLRARTIPGGAAAAVQLAAVLSERDVLRAARGERDVDIRSRLAVLSGEANAAADRGAVQRVKRAADLIARAVASLPPAATEIVSGTVTPSGVPDADLSGLLLSFAYPDRIAVRRSGAEPRYVLANGRGAQFAAASSLAREPLIVAVDLDNREREAHILLAAPLERAQLERYHAERLTREESVEWSEREAAVLARRVLRLDALVLEEQPLPELPSEAALAAMLEGVRRLGVGALPWSRETRELQARIEFVRTHAADAIEAQSWPAVDDAALGASLDAWLAPWLGGITRREHLARLPLGDALRGRLSFEQQRQLEVLAPTHLKVPSGSSIRIDYLDESSPCVAVRLQEVFGLHATPYIAAGRVPVTFKLLSPAQRPVQITRDLASFWRTTYAEVRKDLRGRYPKHYWPEDPRAAQPTRRVRPRP